jgi:hypothetical protein
MSMTCTYNGFAPIHALPAAQWVLGNPGTGAVDVLVRRRMR